MSLACCHGDSAGRTAYVRAIRIEMPNLGGVRNPTRKKRVEPRTAAHQAYVQSLFDKNWPWHRARGHRAKTYLPVIVACRCPWRHIDRNIRLLPRSRQRKNLAISGDMRDKVDPYMHRSMMPEHFLPQTAGQLIEEKDRDRTLALSGRPVCFCLY